MVLQENNTSLDEVVVVGFGKQKKESVIGAIQSVKASELRVPTTNLTNTFAGRIAGVISVQKTGEPGAMVRILDTRSQYIRFGFSSECLDIN